jgi:hypothetical protein
VQNSFNPVTRELAMEEHFLTAIPNDKRWVDQTGLPALPGQGLRLINYVNLRQLRKFEEQAASAAIKDVKEKLHKAGRSSKLDPKQEQEIRAKNGLYRALTHVTLSNVMNVKALLQLRAIMRPGDINLNDAIMKTAAIPYVRNILIQAGGRIKSAEVVGEKTQTIGKIMEIFEGNAPIKKRDALVAEHNALLETYGAARDTEVLANFDVRITVEPFGPDPVV